MAAHGGCSHVTDEAKEFISCPRKYQEYNEQSHDEDGPEILPTFL